MGYTQRFSEGAAVLAQLDPGMYGAGVQDVGPVLLQNYQRCVIVIQTGAMSALVGVDVEQATDVAGTGLKTLDAGSKDLDLTQGGHCYIFEVRPEEFDIANGFDCINVELTLTDNAELAVQILGIVPRFAPVPVTNVTVTD